MIKVTNRNVRKGVKYVSKSTIKHQNDFSIETPVCSSMLYIFTCSKSIEALGKSVKYVQSYQ